MACTGRYGEAWEFATFWCVEGIQTGFDDSGGAGNASLQDTAAHLVDWGIRPGEGMVAYNVTAGTHGPITAVTQTTLTATGVTWSDGDVWRVVPLTRSEIATVEFYLDITSNNVHIALAATGACDCSLAAWAGEFLKKINIIEAGAFYHCPCAKPNITDEQRRTLLEWSDHQLAMLRESKIDVCEGATAADFPSIGWAQQALTERTAAEIIANAIASTS